MDHGRFFMTVCMFSQEFVWMALRDTVKQERVDATQQEHPWHSVDAD